MSRSALFSQRRLRRLAMAAAVEAVLVGGGFALASTTSSPLRSAARPLAIVHGRPPGTGIVWENHSGAVYTAHNTTYSTNWSGFARTLKQTTSLSGTWIIPAVSPSVTAEYSATWLGTDGYGNDNLIQAGTSQDTVQGTAFYYAWWEVLPQAETAISMTVSPGDEMSVALAKVSASTWRITVKDVTAKESWSSTEPYTGKGTSLEGVEEAPTINGAVGTLANFRIVRFSGGSTNSVTARITASEALDMVNSAHKVIAYPQPPKTNGFSVTFGTPKS